MREKRKLLEGLLFLSGGPLPKKDLQRRLSLSEKELSEMVAKANEILKPTAFEIVEGEGWLVLTLKSSVAEELKEIPTGLSKLQLRILGTVLKNPGVTKGKLADLLGSRIYPEVKTLLAWGYLKEKKEGRKRLLFPTELLRRLIG